MSRKYIEIKYEPDKLFPGRPWSVNMGNLPKKTKKKVKYRIYLEEIKDD